jgi:hypothetical protein
MIDVQVLITKLKAETNYTVELARVREPELQEVVDLPIIYIGYASIDSKNPSAPIEHTLFNTHGENLVQSFDIQIVCKSSDLPTIWKTIYTKLITWNPEPLEQYHSGFTYSQGGVMGLANGNLWWLDRWKIGFPTLEVTF